MPATDRSTVHTSQVASNGSAAGSQHAYSLGQLCHGTDRRMDRQTDGGTAVSLNAPYGRGIIIIMTTS